jgi:hypothetical protein
MCELSPWSRGPLLWPVHGGLTTGTGWRAHRCMARGCYGGQELTARAPRKKRGLRGTSPWVKGAARGRSEANDEEQWRWRLKLDEDGVRVTKDGK